MFLFLDSNSVIVTFLKEHASCASPTLCLLPASYFHLSQMQVQTLFTVLIGFRIRYRHQYLPFPNELGMSNLILNVCGLKPQRYSVTLLFQVNFMFAFSIFETIMMETITKNLTKKYNSFDTMTVFRFESKKNSSTLRYFLYCSNFCTIGQI